jgi:hypothetical protein
LILVPHNSQGFTFLDLFDHVRKNAWQHRQGRDRDHLQWPEAHLDHDASQRTIDVDANLFLAGYADELGLNFLVEASSIADESALRSD